MKATEDLPVLLKQAEATEKYLHKVLPIKIETQIYNSHIKVINDNKLKKTLNEYTSGVINDLLNDRKNDELEFDKRKFEVPEIKGIKEVVIEEPPKVETKPSISLVPKKEEDEIKSPAVMSEVSS
jgi:hypothetical protein